MLLPTRSRMGLSLAPQECQMWTLVLKEKTITWKRQAKSIETQRLSQFMESPYFQELIQTEQQKKAFQMKYAKLMGIEDIIAMEIDDA